MNPSPMQVSYLLVGNTSILCRGVIWCVNVNKCNFVDTCIPSSEHIHLSHTERASTCEENRAMLYRFP